MEEYHLSRVVALVAFTFMQVYSYSGFTVESLLISRKGINWGKHSADS
jgi:hypothetical protein